MQKLKLALPRMADWLVVTVILTVLIALTAPHMFGVTLYKLSLVSLAAVAGYWIDRSLFYYARPDCFLVGGREVVFAAAMLRRALIVAACVLGVSLGA